MGKGPLVKVELQPGRFVKMYRDDAIAAGLLDAPEPKKRRQKPADKMRAPAQDKSKSNVVVTDQPAGARAIVTTVADDFTQIPGIGAATAEELRQRGFYTFEDLRNADLAELPWRARHAVEEWRDG